MRKYPASILVFLFIFCGAVFAQAGVNFPVPQGLVNDFAGVLSPADKASLNSVAQSLKDKTGAEMAVAIVKTVSPLDPKLYAVKLFEKWGIGQKGKDNGVLILLVMDERRIEIEVGYGLEGVLPDALCGQILDQYAIPYFKQGQIGRGLLETSKALSARIAKEALPQNSASAQESPGVDPLFLSVIVGLVVFAIIFRKIGSLFWGIFGAVWGSSYAGPPGLIVGALIGFFFGMFGWIFLGQGGGFGGGFGGGGFGGFGGGRSGGGGGGRSW